MLLLVIRMLSFSRQRISSLIRGFEIVGYRRVLIGLSRGKTWKLNHSVNVDLQMAEQKYVKIQKLMKKERFREAIEFVESILPLHEHGIMNKKEIRDMYFWLAIAYLKTSNFSESIKVFTLLIQLFP